MKSTPVVLNVQAALNSGRCRGNPERGRSSRPSVETDNLHFLDVVNPPIEG